MTYDLRFESWIPFRRGSGDVHWGAPSLLTDGISRNPVVGLAAPRPDFEAALLEFLIGLLTVAYARAGLLKNERAWLEIWREAPAPSELSRLFEALPPAFDLDGAGPRFLQDMSSADFESAEELRIEQLFMDAPGEQALRLNTDVFVKRDRATALGRPTAAMALIALQTYAPAGGRGNRTSLRGGGPLTTLVDPRDAVAEPPPLWRKLWANVEAESQWQSRAVGEPRRDEHDLFPWLARTRISEKNLRTTPTDAHPLQCYFGMPRRIRLTFGGSGVCALTGFPDDAMATGFRMRPYGAQYVGWLHPLSPHYRTAQGEKLPVHGQPGGIAWRDWLGLTLRTSEGSKMPSQTVEHFVRRRAGEAGITTFRIHAFGYDFDNMKARAWVDATLPAFVGVDEKHIELLRDAAERMTSATDIAASALLLAVKLTRFARIDDAPEKSALWDSIRAALWNATEEAFYTAIRDVASSAQPPAETEARMETFRATLESETLRIFDRAAEAEAQNAVGARRYVRARFALSSTLRGFGKGGVKLFDALRIQTPETRPSRKGRTAKQRSKA